MKRFLHTLLLSATTLAAAVPVLAERIDLAPGPDTTVFDGPLRTDGTVDYIAALNNAMSEGVTLENNAFVELWLTYEVQDQEEGEDTIAILLQLDGLPEGPVYIGWDRFLESEELGRGAQTDLMFELALEGPFASDDLPLVAAWLDRNGPALARVMSAVDRPRFYAPWTTGPDDETGMVVAVMLPHLGQYRDYARALVIETFHAIGEGRYDHAAASLLATRRLAAHIASEPTLISNLVARSIESLSTQALEAALSHGGFSDAQLRRLAEGWTPQLGGLSMAQAVDLGERVFMLDMLQQAWAGRLGDADDPGGLTAMLGMGESAAMAGVFKLIQHEGFDINTALRDANAAYDEMLEVFMADNYAQYAEQNAAYEAGLAAGLDDADSAALVAASGGEVDDTVVAEDATRLVVQGMQTMLMPAVGAARRTEYAGIVRNDLAQAALAAERFRLAHGRLPVSIDELNRHQPALDVVDRFNGETLRYVPDEDRHGYTLYSLGPNGVDDGGLDDRNAGDIVFRVEPEAGGE